VAAKSAAKAGAAEAATSAEAAAATAAVGAGAYPPRYRPGEYLVNPFPLDGRGRRAAAQPPGEVEATSETPSGQDEVRGQRNAPKERQKMASAGAATAGDKTAGRGSRENRPAWMTAGKVEVAMGGATSKPLFAFFCTGHEGSGGARQRGSSGGKIWPRVDGRVQIGGRARERRSSSGGNSGNSGGRSGSGGRSR
jgi:hypothetical protein